MSDAPEITLYGKPDCHLCDDAEEIVRRLSVQIGVTYRKVSILDSPDLFERYRYRIPVIEVRDGPTLDWPVTLEQIQTAVLAVRSR
jgi:hypothetical protein